MQTAEDVKLLLDRQIFFSKSVVKKDFGSNSEQLKKPAQLNECHINQLNASNAIRYVSQKIESINKFGDNLKPGFMDKYSILLKIRAEGKHLSKRLELPYGRISEEYINQHVPVIEKYKIGCCNEQALVAYKYLKDMGVKNIDIIEFNEGNHVLLVIGRDPTSLGYGENSISSWGKNAYVCDPHQEMTYSVEEFSRKEKEENQKKIPNKYKFLRGIPTIQPLFDKKTEGLYSNRDNRNQLKSRL